jgi:hypothetical protein
LGTTMPHVPINAESVHVGTGPNFSDLATNQKLSGNSTFTKRTL